QNVIIRAERSYFAFGISQRARDVERSTNAAFLQYFSSNGYRGTRDIVERERYNAPMGANWHTTGSKRAYERPVALIYQSRLPPMHTIAYKCDSKLATRVCV